MARKKKNPDAEKLAESILKSQRNMTIDETVMAIRRLKRALVK